MYVGSNMPPPKYLEAKHCNTTKVEHHDLPHNSQGPLSDCWNHLEFFSLLSWMHLLNVLDVLHVILDHCIHTQMVALSSSIGPEVEVDPCVWLCTLSSIDHQCLNTSDLDVEPWSLCT